MESRATVPPTVTCPHCGKAVAWDASRIWKPFCSERCRLIDLGGWLSEKHVIPGNPEPASEEEAAD